MTLVKIMNKLIAPVPDILKYDRFLFIGPHPDDIEIGAGSTAARLVDMGKEVNFLVITDGCYGTEDTTITKEKLAEIRKTEAQNAAESLGVKNLTMLGYSDGGMYKTEDAAADIAREIVKTRAEVIFCPDHKLKTECHADHLKIGLAASNAFIISGNHLFMRDLGIENSVRLSAIAYYFTDRPNVFIGTRKVFKKQIAAIGEHKSQMSYDMNGRTYLDLMRLYLTFRGVRFGIRSLKGRAEGFRVLSPIHTHCCAEKL